MRRFDNCCYDFHKMSGVCSWEDNSWSSWPADLSTIWLKLYRAPEGTWRNMFQTEVHKRNPVFLFSHKTFLAKPFVLCVTWQMATPSPLASFSSYVFHDRMSNNPSILQHGMLRTLFMTDYHSFTTAAGFHTKTSDISPHVEANVSLSK